MFRLRSFAVLGVVLLIQGVLVTGKEHYCADPEHKKDPVCICRLPMNYSLEICKQDINWWTKTKTEKKNGKIVGGELAPGDAYPWFARMMRRSGSWAGCGGMLVAPEYVLTAAHCAVNYIASNSAVLIGAVCPYANDNCGQPSQLVNVASILTHPGYNDNTYDNDYALMKLVSRADATPVPMDHNKYVPNYSQGKRGLWAIGFGTTSSGGSTSNKLRHVEVAFVPSDTCNSDYGGGITDNMICAADPGQDSCQGDSGGPLYDEANNAVVGVVSWGYGCANPNYPGVYSKVSEKWDWIKSNICDGHSNPKPSFCITEPTKSPSPTPAPTVSPTIAPTPAPTPCGDGKIDVKVSFTPDEYTNENRWEVTDSTGTLVGESGDLGTEGITEVSDLCLDSSDCYTFTFYDSYGDGLFEPGALTVSVNTISVLSIIQYDDFFVKTVNFGQCDACSSEDFLGRTLFLPLGACYKVDFFSQGTVSVDLSDPSCSNTEEYNADAVISGFDYSGNQNIYFTSGPGPYSGQFNFLEDPTLTEMSVAVNDLADNNFDLTVTVPSCDMGAPYPCIEQSLLGSTVFVPIMNICFKIELFEGGQFVGDTTDSTCSKDEVDHTASIVASDFDYAAGHKVYFAGAFTGSFALNMDPSVTAIEAATVSLDTTGRTFEFSLTFPSCDPLISTAPVSSPSNNECTDVPNWVDSYGDGCDWYIPDSRCEDFGYWYSNLGYTAIEACCVCGGGEYS